ncbi:MAG: winged helix-turn-helix transcriptional regulator [Dehalococcoidales bacterium]|nr:winged helix-turn-helix transcriptional regulator [Dehalococcoidales bacterium]
MGVEILQNKNAATRFQIMVEIASGGPFIPQKTIAAKLGITPQAVSDYIQQLTEEELIEATGRSSYRVSTKGVNWMLKILREFRSYAASAEQAVTNITVCAAVASDDIEAGQRVGLVMEDGILMATAPPGDGARGTAVSSAKKGEDVGVTSIEGLVEFTKGKVTILQVPVIRRGGSGRVDLEKLQRYAGESRKLGAIGIEALVALRRIAREPSYCYGVTEAAIEAAQCGLSFCVVCTEDAVPELMRNLHEKNIDYTLVDLSLKG